MSIQADFETIRRAFVIFNGFEGPGNDELWWRTDDEYGPITLFVNCNDLFFWGCADCEVLTPDNIGDLEKAYQDATDISKECTSFAHLLWIARLRSMRPQGAYYKYFPTEMHELFNQCGPNREVGLGNPKEKNGPPVL